VAIIDKQYRKMKQNILLLFLFYSIVTFSQKKEMAENFRKGNYDKTIEIGKQLLEKEPKDFETILFIARAEDEKGNFENAIHYLDNAKKLMSEDWQKSWTFLELAKNCFGTGKIENAKLYYNEALKIKGTKNSEKELKKFGMLTGLDAFYKSWKIKETKDIIFHYENSINDNDIERITKTRQIAFEEINTFFNSKLPKKIDFFVWNITESYNPILNVNLGFSNPVFCISHNRLNQTPGHEIAHNISYWKNNDNIRTKFINEGIGVCFDQQKNEKLKIAQETYKASQIDIKEIWKNQTKLNDDLLYPIAGAFINFLIEYDKEKFLKLTENQTYENAIKVYGENIDNLIDDFIKKLKE
jgi:tetratricopeptide (TPR) repeat protein